MANLKSSWFICAKNHQGRIQYYEWFWALHSVLWADTVTPLNGKSQIASLILVGAWPLWTGYDDGMSAFYEKWSECFKVCNWPRSNFFDIRIGYTCLHTKFGWNFLCSMEANSSQIELHSSHNKIICLHV